MFKILVGIGLVGIAIVILQYYFYNGSFLKKNKTVFSSTFHYQLQNVKYSDLKTLPAKMMVVDIDDAQLSQSELKALQGQGKKILSYLSIGEAEEYRDYWKQEWKPGNPTFLDKENPEWKGNYKVHYWENEWKNIIFEKVKQIQDAGYDGVYLDIIDAYEYYKDLGRKDADQEMMLFVVQISQQSKERNIHFLVVPQNSPELYQNHSYKNSIDGLGKEDLWYSDDLVRSDAEVNADLQYLRQATFDGKFVFSIDYLAEQKNICDYYKKCQEQNFFCMVSSRDLDKNIGKNCFR